MNYLKKYGITLEQIEEIKDVLNENNVNIDIFEYDPEKVIAILNLFTSIGVNNIYEIIITSPSMFCDTIKSIELRLNSYEDKEELVKLLNDDANNLYLVDLM